MVLPLRSSIALRGISAGGVGTMDLRTANYDNDYV